MLGSLISCINGVFKAQDLEILNLTPQEKLELARDMFRESCLNDRTKMIQDFKKSNIKEIHK